MRIQFTDWEFGEWIPDAVDKREKSLLLVLRPENHQERLLCREFIKDAESHGIRNTDTAYGPDGFGIEIKQGTTQSSKVTAGLWKKMIESGGKFA